MRTTVQLKNNSQLGDNVNVQGDEDQTSENTIHYWLQLLPIAAISLVDGISNRNWKFDAYLELFHRLI